jgi:hypothetical protein
VDVDLRRHDHVKENLMTLNEWGLAERPAKVGLGAAAPAPTQSPAGTIVGLIAGAAAGAYIGNTMKQPAIGAAVGGLAGGVAGYFSTKPAAPPATASPTPGPYGSPTALPPGPYARVSSAGGSIALQPNETYLVSVPIGSSTTGLSDWSSQIQQLGLTLLGAWVTAPAGWPPGDPNVGSGLGVYAAVQNGTAAAISVGQQTTVWATNGMAS